MYSLYKQNLFIKVVLTRVNCTLTPQLKQLKVQFGTNCCNCAVNSVRCTLQNYKCFL